MSKWISKVSKHLENKGFVLIRHGSHMVWRNKEGIQIVSSCTPKHSQFENIIKEIDRDIKRKEEIRKY